MFPTLNSSYAAISKSIEAGILQLVKVELDQNQLDALASFVFNIGLPAFKKSVVLRRLNKGDVVGAANAMSWWNKALINRQVKEMSGLVRRRSAERALFLETSGIGEAGDEAADASSIRPIENRPRRHNILASRTFSGAVLAGAAGALIAGASFIDGAPFDLNQTGDSTHTNTSTALSLIDMEGFKASEYQDVFQLAGTVMIFVAVLYIIYARVDDWFRYRR